MPTPTSKELMSAILAIVSELTTLSEDEIGYDERLREDLGLDSLQAMEMISRLSEDYDIDPDMDEVMSLGTVIDVQNFLMGHIQAESD